MLCEQTVISVMNWNQQFSLQMIKLLGTAAGATGPITTLFYYFYSKIILHTGQDIPFTAPCVVTAEPKNARNHHFAKF